MDVRQLLDAALGTVDGSQAALARRLGVSETTVSRWRAGKNGIDFESALRLARITGIPADEVLEACGLDADLLTNLRLARGDANYGSTINPEISALLDRDRAELLEVLEGIDPIWHKAILSSQRYARSAAERHAAEMEQRDQERISKARKDELAPPNRRPRKKGGGGEFAGDGTLAERFHLQAPISRLLSAATA